MFTLILDSLRPCLCAMDKSCLKFIQVLLQLSTVDLFCVSFHVNTKNDILDNNSSS